MIGRRRVLGISLLAAAVVLIGCGPEDPKAAVLAERAAWKVQPRNWVRAEDGSILVSAIVQGPVHARLEHLTFRIELSDEQAQPLEPVWWTLDLSGIHRGEPKDVTLRIPAPAGQVAAISIDPVLAPSPEEERRIKELSLP